MAEVVTKRSARAGGRQSRRALRTAVDTRMLPGLTNTLPPCEIMNGSQVERIDATSMDILENIGVVFRDDIALDDWRRAGAKVEGDRVYLDRGMVRDLEPSRIAGHVGPIALDKRQSSDRDDVRRPLRAGMGIVPIGRTVGTRGPVGSPPATCLGWIRRTP